MRPTCKNVVLARVVGSMSEFKQIIGRGTRVRDDYGKLWFSTSWITPARPRGMFADPEFDGDPALVTEEELKEYWQALNVERRNRSQNQPRRNTPPPIAATRDRRAAESRAEPRKFYFDGGQVEIVAHLVYELDPDGKQLRVIRYTDYAGEKVRTPVPRRERTATDNGPTQRHVPKSSSPLPNAASASMNWRKRPASRRPIPST